MSLNSAFEHSLQSRVRAYTECVVLSFDFKLPDENYVLLRVLRENNMHNVDLKNIVPSGDLTCLFAKATLDESNLWHRRLGHINFKTMNKLVKGIMRKFSVARTPQQNRVAERKNKTLIEAARTMLADSLLPIPFWAEAVNTACYVQNRADERFLVRYFINSKTFRVFSRRTRIVQETFHINFLENQPNVVGSGATWLFDINTLTQSMNYQPVTAGNQPHFSASIQGNFDASKVVKEAESAQQYVLLPLWSTSSKDPHITDADAAFDDTGNESEVHVSLNMPALEEIVYSNDEEDVDVEADFSNLETSITVNPIPTTRVHTDHPITQIIGDLSSAPQTRNLPKGKRAIGSKWVFRNKKDEIGIVIMNKARLVAQGHTQEEGIDYKELFAPVARIEAIRLFLAYASFMGFMVYQMDVKNDFLYETIKEEAYVYQPSGFKDPDYPDKVYVDDIIFGSTNKDPCKAFEKLMKDKFQMSSMGELTFFLGLQVKQKERGIFISQDKYVAEILRKFGLTDGKSASTPIDTEKPLLKDPDVKRTFRYLKGKPHLVLWYPKNSPFNLVAYSDSDYAGASLDKKSTTGGCQFLGCRLISWQYKKQTVVATSSTEAEYVAAASCCAQVLWIQNLIIIAVSSKLMLFGLTNDVVHLMLLGHSPTIYVSCIKQFWDSVSIKNSNDAVKFQALIDRKKVIITKDTIRQALQLDDADGIDCLPNEEIFIELARMGYEKPSTKLTFYKAFFLAQWTFLIHTIIQCMSVKRTAWNKFSSSMASAIIFLATKVANLEQDKIAQALEITKLKQRVRRRMHPNRERGINELDADEDVTLVDMDAKVAMDANIQGRMAESQAKVFHLDMQHVEKVLSMHDTDEAEPAEVKEVLEVVTASKLMIEVVTTVAPITTDAQVLKPSAPKKEEVLSYKTLRRHLQHQLLCIQRLSPRTKAKAKEYSLKNQPLKRQAQIEHDEAFARQLEAKLNANINWNDVLEQVKRVEKQDNTVMRYQALKRKHVTQAQARKNMMVYLKNMAGFNMDFFKGMTYNEIRPIFEKHYNSIKAFLEKEDEEVTVQEKRKGENLEQDTVKKQKIDEETGGAQKTFIDYS
uniref:Copia protein n=1 Tax=Tanacetum cinerariifolium TaxID=118510 RepID=A0A699GYR3_TANCI|nr:copia protein [Tanacetum cinerariifolium]